MKVFKGLLVLCLSLSCFVGSVSAGGVNSPLLQPLFQVKVVR